MWRSCCIPPAIDNSSRPSKERCRGGCSGHIGEHDIISISLSPGFAIERLRVLRATVRELCTMLGGNTRMRCPGVSSSTGEFFHVSSKFPWCCTHPHQTLSHTSSSSHPIHHHRMVICPNLLSGMEHFNWPHAGLVIREQLEPTVLLARVGGSSHRPASIPPSACSCCLPGEYQYGAPGETRRRVSGLTRRRDEADAQARRQRMQRSARGIDCNSC